MVSSLGHMAQLHSSLAHRAAIRRSAALVGVPNTCAPVLKLLPASRTRCVAVYAANSGGMLQKLGRLLKEKAQSDLNRVFNGTSKTREKLGVTTRVLSSLICLVLFVACQFSDLWLFLCVATLLTRREF